MLGDEQRVVLLGLPDQPASDQRAPFEVKRGSRFLGYQTFELTLCLGMTAKVMLEQIEMAVVGCRYVLKGFAVTGREGSAQYFMARHQPIQCFS